jgi:hypothetical protein
MKKIHINPQSKGSLGKSFETECRATYLDAIGVPWFGYDLDDRHSTFRDRHPDKVKLINLEDGSKDQLLKMMADVLARPEPVILIDSRAQADLLIREAFTSLGIFDRCKSQGAEFVISLFPSDDNESLTNLAEIVRWGAGKAQFLIVRNPAKAKAHIFDQSAMRPTLIEKLGAKEIAISEVTSTSLQALERLERETKRAWSFGEFANGIERVDPLITGEFAYLLGQMSRQYTAIASVLLPPEELPKVPKIRAPKAESKTPDLDLSL